MLREAVNISEAVNPLSSAGTTQEGKYFDLISWDPRGVNNTTPHLECFHDALSYDVWRYQEDAGGIDHTSDISLSLAWARWKALMETCAKGNEIAKHMNTVLVVRDMVEIIDRHAEWRNKQAELWLASKEGKSATSGKENGDLYSWEAVLDRTKWYKGDEKLQYWGFSYGTVLGATFAALYPERVGRMVLDGVADAYDYYSTGWMRNLNDTDKIMSKFYEYCSEAGPEKCAMNIGNSSSSDIQNSVETLISSLHEDPISVPGNSTRSPAIVTYLDVLSMFRTMLYRPLHYFPEMAELLADLVHGNGTAFAVYKQNAYKRSCPLTDAKDKKSGGSSCQPSTGGEEVTRVILCSDGRDISNSTKVDFKGNITALYQQSKYFGLFWSSIIMPCSHWKVRPTWSITAGKTLTSESLSQTYLRSDEIKGKTIHPILLVGNTLDPVTPVAK
jgi:pimeloyl-ACP methyl ester carboxylesterase